MSNLGKGREDSPGWIGYGPASPMDLKVVGYFCRGGVVWQWLEKSPNYVDASLPKGVALAAFTIAGH